MSAVPRSAWGPATIALALLLAGGLSAVPPAWAQSPPKVALVVGNAAYEHAAPLANPKNDAEDMATALEGLGFAVERAMNLDYRAFTERVLRFSKRTKGAEAALFYYAGHGLQVGGVNYLLPVDVALEDEMQLRFQTVDLTAVLQGMRSSANLVFLDACRDNPFVRSVARSMGTRSFAVGRGLAPVEDNAYGGAFIAFATAAGEVASDGDGRNSPFTAALKQHIGSPGLEINQVLNRVRRELAGIEQEPWATSSLVDDFYFSARPSVALPVPSSNAPIAPRVDPAEELWNQIRASNNAGQFERFMRAFPKSPLVHSARARLDELQGQPFTVVVDPASARVRILNIKPPYRAGMKLPVGEYRVEASAEGYKTKVEMVAHGSSQTTHRIALLHSGQPFTIKSEPSSARIKLIGHAKKYRPGMTLPPGDYIVEALAEGYQAKTQTVKHGSVPTVQRIVLRETWKVGSRLRDCPNCPQLAVLPSGSFTMGSTFDTRARRSLGSVREVNVVMPFALGVYEVTFAEWDACVNDGGCGGYIPDDNGWGRGKHPVINVSWDDAEKYVDWLSRQTGERYRLPSEAEWEYAARAGSMTTYHFGDSVVQLCRYANHADSMTSLSSRNMACSDGVGKRTARVGAFSPNDLGLYDMYGNVWEWTQDCWNPSYAHGPADTSALSSDDCARRVLRGGSWANGPRSLQSTYRVKGDAQRYYYGLAGFRVLREL